MPSCNKFPSTYPLGGQCIQTDLDESLEVTEYIASLIQHISPGETDDELALKC